MPDLSSILPPISSCPPSASRVPGLSLGGPTFSPDAVPRLAQLRASVASHVCGRRAQGASIDLVLTELSGVVQRAGGLTGVGDALGLLNGQVRSWGLDAYFDDPELRNAPRFY